MVFYSFQQNTFEHLIWSILFRLSIRPSICPYVALGSFQTTTTTTTTTTNINTQNATIKTNVCRCYFVYYCLDICPRPRMGGRTNGRTRGKVYKPHVLNRLLLTTLENQMCLSVCSSNLRKHMCVDELLVLSYKKLMCWVVCCSTYRQYNVRNMFLWKV